MKKRSKGVREFAQPTTGFGIRSQLRFMAESGRDVSSIISPDWIPIGPQEPIIPQRELTPWFNSSPPYITTLHSWDEDFWMTREIASVYSHRQNLEKVYITVMQRGEKMFYQDFCPIRYNYSSDILWSELNDTLDKFKPCENGFVCLGNFALSIAPPTKMILDRAKQNKITISYPKLNRTILWARYDYLRQFKFGHDIIRVYKHMDEKALKYGIPSFPLHLETLLEDI